MKKNSLLDTRVAFCRLVLRVERLSELTSRHFHKIFLRHDHGSRTALGQTNSNVSERNDSRSRTASQAGGADCDDCHSHEAEVKGSKDSQRSSSRTSHKGHKGEATRLAGILPRYAESSMGNSSGQGQPQKQRYITFRQVSNGGASKGSNIFDDSDEDDEASTSKKVSKQLKELKELLKARNEPSSMEPQPPHSHAHRGSANGAHAAHGADRGGDHEDTPRGRGDSVRYSAANAPGQRNSVGGELWKKAVADAANRAAAEMLRARNAHEQHTTAFRAIVQQILDNTAVAQPPASAGALGTANGGREGRSPALSASFSSQLEAADAAAAKAKSAMITAGEDIIEAAAAVSGGVPDHLRRGGGSGHGDPSTLAIERLRQMTQKLGLGEETFEGHVSRAMAKRAAKACKAGFVSYVDWPPSHPPFVSNAKECVEPACCFQMPKAEAMTRCLPTAELRFFLADLFEADAKGRDDILKMPSPLISMIEQALDHDGSGFITMTNIGDRWPLLFGARRSPSLSHVDSLSPLVRVHDAGIARGQGGTVGRMASRSLPANLLLPSSPPRQRTGSVKFSDHV